MSQDFDVVIAGGGLNGPVLALALAGAGLRVAVVDPRPAEARAEEAARTLLSIWDALKMVDVSSRCQVLTRNIADLGVPDQSVGVSAPDGAVRDGAHLDPGGDRRGGR